MLSRFSIFSFFFFLLSILFPAFSQDKFNDKFNDANLLMDEKLYAVAIPLWLEILESDSNNSNWNYKVGICYLNSSIERTKSLPYLEKAILKTTKNYNPFSVAENKSPADAYFYLARAYHLNNQLDLAIEYFNKFKETAGKKHYLNPEADRSIEMCNNAKEIMAKSITLKITNIGNKINTAYPEYGPVVSLDERALYFTSRRLRKDSSNMQFKERSDGMYFEDIYVSFKDKNDQWQGPELLNFSRPSDHEATISISADGQTLYLYRDEDGNGNLYQSFLFGEIWSAPVLLGSDINTKSHETHMTVSLDGKTLYFVSNRPGGQGGKDIYLCTKLPNGKWSLAQNLGSSINTPFDEDGPFIHPDGKTLYFSSKGHKSIGGFDIFMSALKDDGIWTEPQNIGYPVNTTDDDIFFVMSPDGKRAYYSSFRSDGMGDKDIYIIEQPDATEKSLTLIKGYITVPETQTLPENLSIIITDNETGDFITEAKPLRRNGSFVFVIPQGKNYNASYNLDEKEFYNENIYVPFGSEYTEVDKEIHLNPDKIGTPDAVTINIKKSNEKKKIHWLIRNREKKSPVPENTILQYLDENGNVIYEETISQTGLFAYHVLGKTTPYIFTLKSKDNRLCKQGEIIVFGKEDSSYKFLPDENCIFREVKERKMQFVFDALGKDIQSGLIVQYLDNTGKVLFEEKMDGSGFFVYRELSKDNPYPIKIKTSDNTFNKTLCDEGEIIIPGLGSNEYTMVADDNCIFRLKEKKSKFIFSSLDKDFVQGLSLIASDESGILFNEKFNEKGEFPYHRLTADKNLVLKLNYDNVALFKDFKIFVAASGRKYYIFTPDASGIFKKSNTIYEEDIPMATVNVFLKSKEKELLVADNILYELNSAKITPQAAKQLDKVILLMQQNPDVIAELFSHTDSRGDEKTNMQLSEKRAQAAVQYIISKGINSKRILGKGYGETKILNHCTNGASCSEEEHEINRRTEFRFSRK